MMRTTCSRELLPAGGFSVSARRSTSLVISSTSLTLTSDWSKRPLDVLGDLLDQLLVDVAGVDYLLEHVTQRLAKVLEHHFKVLGPRRVRTIITFLRWDNNGIEL